MPITWRRGEGRKEGRKEAGSGKREAGRKGQPGAHGLANYGKEKAPRGLPKGP